MAFDWGSAIGAAVSLYGANRQASAAKDAGNQSAAGSQQSVDLSKYIYDDQRNLNMPAYNAGNTARDQYMRMLGLQPNTAQPQAASAQPYDAGAAYLQANPDVAAHSGWGRDPLGHYNRYGRGEGRAWNATAPTAATPATPAAAAPQSLSAIYDQFRNTPGYQFGLQEGNKSIQASAAARGGLNSGAALKSLQKYGTDYADQKGYQPYMNSLSNLFGGAQTAVSNIGSAGANYGQQAGAAYQNAANSRANSTYQQGQAWQQGLNDVAGFAGDWYGNTYGGGG